MTAPLLTVTALRKRFGARTVLDDVSFTVPRGQVVAIVGPSGAGKTSLLRAINGLERPDAGTIELAGVSVDYALRSIDKPLLAVRRRTAMVFQSFNLFPHRTALENVIEGLHHVRKVPRAEAIERGRALLARMGLADRADDYPAALSGGQRQRVAIARGLVMEPDLMLFDEPTSALDPELRREVVEVIRELAATGMTMLIVTHERDLVRAVADRAIAVKEGRIEADGNPTEEFELRLQTTDFRR